MIWKYEKLCRFTENNTQHRFAYPEILGGNREGLLRI